VSTSAPSVLEITAYVTDIRRRALADELATCSGAPAVASVANSRRLWAMSRDRRAMNALEALGGPVLDVAKATRRPFVVVERPASNRQVAVAPRVENAPKTMPFAVARGPHRVRAGYAADADGEVDHDHEAIDPRSDQDATGRYRCPFDPHCLNSRSRCGGVDS
jgi:hypothetical protein